MSTQIQAAAPDAGEPTVIVADDNATALAGLAWSDTDDDETFSFDQHDRTTFWLRLYVGTIAVVVVVLGVMPWTVLAGRALWDGIKTSVAEWRLRQTPAWPEKTRETDPTGAVFASPCRTGADA